MFNLATEKKLPYTINKKKRWVLFPQGIRIEPQHTLNGIIQTMPNGSLRDLYFNEIMYEWRKKWKVSIGNCLNRLPIWQWWFPLFWEVGIELVKDNIHSYIDSYNTSLIKLHVITAVTLSYQIKSFKFNPNRISESIMQRCGPTILIFGMKGGGGVDFESL